VERILNKALSKVPSERFASVSLFANNLSDVEVSGDIVRLATDTAPAKWTATENVLNGVLQRLGFSGTLLSTGLTTAPKASVSESYYNPSIEITAACYDASYYARLGLSRESLYKGEVGIALLASDLSRPEAACMPFFEREGWPTQGERVRGGAALRVQADAPVALD
jgi:hypothetical protein